MNLIRHTPRGAGLLPVPLFFLILTSAAHAHTTVEGAGALGNGALHPLMTPAHVLILLGLGLLLGQQVPLGLGRAVRVFAPASAAALLLTATGRVPAVYPPLMIGIALGLSILVALETRLNGRVAAALCATAAVGIGLDSAVDPGTAAAAGFKMLIGTWFTMNALVFYTAVCASNGADKKWARAGIRVIGSWILAISLMALAFSLRK